MDQSSQFDCIIQRRGTGCLKWDECNSRFRLPPDAPVIPMWVADMDFAAPQPVIDALLSRVNHGVYGYENPQPRAYEAVKSWVGRRYGWEIEADWILFTPGVVSGLNLAVQALATPGDGIIIQQPVYYPFAEIIKNNGCRLVNNGLQLRGGQYAMDYEDLERKAREPENRLMILCSPHNPGGRVWAREELLRVAEICADNGVVLLSDEIHADLLLEGQQHSATASLSQRARACTIACYAPSKTFNLPGLQTAFLVIADKGLRAKVAALHRKNCLGGADILGMEAMIAAYTLCDSYVDELREYIRGNVDVMEDYLQKNLPQLRLMRPQGTYLAWVDFSATGMDDEVLGRFLLEKAGIATDPGVWFGEGGQGFSRFNLGCPRSLLLQALDQLNKAFAVQ